MKPHIKVIQRNGVDIFVTSSMTMKATKAEKEKIAAFRRLDNDVAIGGRHWAQINRAKSQTITTSGVASVEFLPPYGGGYWMQTKSPN
jgi:hypothetical protein